MIVHRLLQATIESTDKVKNYTLNPREINKVCDYCKEKLMAAKEAQERCDRVFLSLFVQANPMKSKLGIVLSESLLNMNVVTVEGHCKDDDVHAFFVLYSHFAVFIGGKVTQDRIAHLLNRRWFDVCLHDIGDCGYASHFENQVAILSIQ